MGNPLQKVVEFIKVSSPRRTISLIVILIIAAAIPLTVMVSQQQQETRQRAAAPTAPVPGTCLVLPQEFCATGKKVTDPDGTYKGVGFVLPDNTPIFAYDSGVLSSNSINVATNTYRGVSLSTAGSININTYFKDTLTSGTTAVSKKVTKGEILGYTHKDPHNPYDLLINFSKLGKNTITIDQQLTKTNFGL